MSQKLTRAVLIHGEVCGLVPNQGQAETFVNRLAKAAAVSPNAYEVVEVEGVEVDVVQTRKVVRGA